MIAAALSAGGAQLDQLAILATVYLGGTVLLLWLVYAHRSGRTRLLAKAAGGAAWVFRAPGWVSLPVLVASISLILTMGGGFWDIGYHIDYGRDTGPLGNPGHYPMLVGFFGTFAAGILCIGLADESRAGPSWVRIAPGWRVPVGGLLLIACSAFGLAALPLDDVWHRIFGQDVTLWSPTHFMLLGGATVAIIAMAVLVAEARVGRKPQPPSDVPPARSSFGATAERAWARIQRFALLGGMLVGLEAFLAEFDWGVPLYRQVWQPLLLMAFAAFIFSAARGWAGRGGAIGAWGLFIGIRLLASLIPVIAGRSLASLPLLLLPALCVELVAWRLDPRRRTIAFGVVAGLVAGSLGFVAEYGWTQLVMPLPWGPGLIPEGLLSATIAGVGGGVLGALLASGLRAELPRRRVARIAFVGAFVALIGIGINAGIRDLPQATAHVELTDVSSGPERTALATVRIDPASAADDANWLYVLAWQGGPGTQRVVDRLEPMGDGVYRSTEPIPLYGSWKSGLRLQTGRERGAVPLRLPADDAFAGSSNALPTSFTAANGAEVFGNSSGAELTAPASFSRPFLEDGLIMLRESNGEVPSWISLAAISLIALVYILFISALALGVARLTRTRERGPAPVAAPTAAALAREGIAPRLRPSEF